MINCITVIFTRSWSEGEKNKAFRFNVMDRECRKSRTELIPLGAPSSAFTYILNNEIRIIKTYGRANGMKPKLAFSEFYTLSIDDLYVLG